MPGRGDELAGKLLHFVRSGLLRSGYQMLPRWSSSRLARNAFAATAIWRLLREASGTSPPLHGPAWAATARAPVGSPSLMDRTPSRFASHRARGGRHG